MYFRIKLTLFYLNPMLRPCQSQLNPSCGNLFDTFTITWIKRADNLIISFVFVESYAMKKSDVTLILVLNEQIRGIPVISLNTMKQNETVRLVNLFHIVFMCALFYLFPRQSSYEWTGQRLILGSKLVSKWV